MILKLFLGTFIVGVILQFVAMVLGKGFISQERKKGSYRAESGQGVSSKLPMTGGVMVILTFALAMWACGRMFDAVENWWIPVVAFALFGAVGFTDDFLKFRGRGMSERWKTIACAVAAIAIAFLLHGEPAGSTPVWRLLIDALFLFSIAVAADFSDGIDGLSAGIGMIAAYAMICVSAVAGRIAGVPAFVSASGAIAAFWVFNLPSAWTSKSTDVKRHARVYLGDSGSLAIGGGLAATALWLHLGWVFVAVAAVWILEGFSSLWQAQVLTKWLYRPGGRVEIYGNEWAPHNEFPLPLLAAPVHHHFEMAGFRRDRIVLWFLIASAVCGIGGVVAAKFSIWMLIGWLIAAVPVIMLWSLASLFRTMYLAIDEHKMLVMKSGIPFRLEGIPYNRLVQTTGLSVTEMTDDELLWLKRPMTRLDAMEVLSRILSAHKREEASVVASKMPEAARKLRLADIVMDKPDASA